MDLLPIPTVTKAFLQPLPKGKAIEVHFNPASLVYSLENSTKQQGRDPKRRQYAGQFTGKLTMDLQFDTTATGDDVRKITNQVALFMESSAQSSKAASKSGANAPAQPVVAFQWGTYIFKGIMESFKETIDYFSADGVPLRALVSIGLARQDNVFGEDRKLPGTNVGAGDVVATSSSVVPSAHTDSVTSAATKGGDPTASRALAAANGIENPRFTGGADLQVGGGIQFNATAGFVASASAGAGIGFGAGASAGFGASAGISLGGQASIGGGALFGAKASAGVPASAGAFAGLEAGRAIVSTTATLDPLSMVPATVGSDVSVDANASFSLGGAAQAQSGFSTDVGANFSFNERLVFDSD
jgi:Contractile injection system tube protein